MHQFGLGAAERHILGSRIQPNDGTGQNAPLLRPSEHLLEKRIKILRRTPVRVTARNQSAQRSGVPIQRETFRSSDPF